MIASFGRAPGITVLVWASVLAEVLFGLLDAGENLVEERLVFGLLAIFQNDCQIGECS